MVEVTLRWFCSLPHSPTRLVIEPAVQLCDACHTLHGSVSFTGLSGFHPFAHVPFWCHPPWRFLLYSVPQQWNTESCNTTIMPSLVLFVLLDASLVSSFSLPPSPVMFSFSKHLTAMNTSRFHPNLCSFLFWMFVYVVPSNWDEPLPLHFSSPCSMIPAWTFLWDPRDKTLFSLLMISIAVNFKFGINTLSLVLYIYIS